MIMNHIGSHPRLGHGGDQLALQIAEARNFASDIPFVEIRIGFASL